MLVFIISAVKRLMKEAQELKDPTEQYFAQPLDVSDVKNTMQGLRFPLARSPEASETQLGRVKAICDLARLASGIIVVISVFNSLLNNVFCLCTAWHAHTVFSYVYGRYYTHTLSNT